MKHRLAAGAVTASSALAVAAPAEEATPLALRGSERHAGDQGGQHRHAQPPRLRGFEGQPGDQGGHC